MSTEFRYLIDKINDSSFTEKPFRHIYIEELFTAEHFSHLTKLPEINIGPQKDDDGLFSALFESGYQIINFPGCITDQRDYVQWHAGAKGSGHHSACEGFGVTVRLTDPESEFLLELKEFLAGREFNECIAGKLGIAYDQCRVDGGIQKYLDGYEISPHPDIRKKAATFMVNINPNDLSEAADHHTHYLTFKPEREYVKTFWEGNEKTERCWVPWDWCDSSYQQSKNNTLVMFSPANDSMHAVKASYDHLSTQRTQLYGNLWYKESEVEKKLAWEDFDFQVKSGGRGSKPNSSVSRAFNKLGRIITGKSKQMATRTVGRD